MYVEYFQDEGNQHLAENCPAQNRISSEYKFLQLQHAYAFHAINIVTRPQPDAGITVSDIIKTFDEKPHEYQWKRGQNTTILSSLCQTLKICKDDIPGQRWHLSRLNQNFNGLLEVHLKYNRYGSVLFL